MNIPSKQNQLQFLQNPLMNVKFLQIFVPKTHLVSNYLTLNPNPLCEALRESFSMYKVIEALWALALPRLSRVGTICNLHVEYADAGTFNVPVDSTLLCLSLAYCLSTKIGLLLNFNFLTP